MIVYEMKQKFAGFSIPQLICGACSAAYVVSSKHPIDKTQLKLTKKFILYKSFFSI